LTPLAHDAVGTVGRIIDAFPGDKQPQILMQSAASIQAAISQRLLPHIDTEERVPATEVMLATKCSAQSNS
jgi:Tfp pilus assembly pilus retraction ATPase PilT